MVLLNKNKKTMKLLTFLLLLVILSCEQQPSPQNQQKYQDNFMKVQSEVSDWIKKHALYPDSYESVSFSEYSESFSKRHDEKIPNTENYVIKHTHTMLGKDSILSTFTGYFILEFDYSVSVIETERSNSFGGAFPPETQIWIEKFGRPENRQDTIELQQKRKQLDAVFFNELKDAYERGDIITENPQDMQVIKNIIDTSKMGK